jgi:hypothetical protein
MHPSREFRERVYTPLYALDNVQSPIGKQADREDGRFSFGAQINFQRGNISREEAAWFIV